MSVRVEMVVQRVEGDALCRQCGYNLRGMEVTGSCPECGAMVENSIFGDLLQYSSVRWLKKVRSGFTVVLWGVVVQFVGGIAGAILFAGNPTLMEAWALAAGLVALMGIWWMTEPEPADRFAITRPVDVKARRLARTGLLVSVGLQVARIGVSAAGAGGAETTQERLLEVMTAVANLTVELALLTYVAGLAGRMPHRELARMARGIRTAYAIVMGIAVAVSGLAVVFSRGPVVTGGLDSVSGCGMALLELGAVVVAVLELVLLVRVRRQMGRQVGLAKLRARAAEARRVAPALGGI